MANVHATSLRYAVALRSAVATVGPFYAAIVLGEPLLVWAALGGWLGALADPGGTGRARAIAIGGFAAGGGLTVALGLLAAPTPFLAACVLGAIVFGASMLRASSPAASVVGTVLAITAAIATSVTTVSSPLLAAAWFTVGAGWPVLLSSLVWGGPPAERPVPPPLTARETVLRHATCVLIAALVAFGVGTLISPGHVSWITATVVAVMQPYPAATLTRALERVFGTVIGCLVVLAIMRYVHAPLAGALVMLALTAAAVLARPRSYRMFVAFLTPVFVLVASRLYADWDSVALRLFDVVLGGLLAVLATLAEHQLAVLSRRGSPPLPRDERTSA